MKHLLLFTFSLLLFTSSLSPSFATEMAAKAKVLKTFDTVRSGRAELTCDDPKGWTFDVSAALDAHGRDVIAVNLSSPFEAMPPKFGVFVRVPGAGVQNVWNCDYARGSFSVDPQLWWGWKSRYVSELARNAPMAIGFNAAELAPVAIACSEAFDRLEFGLYADDRTCDMIGRCEFFTGTSAPRKSYSAKILVDRRGGFWYDTVRDCAAWIAEANGFAAAPVPESARDPLYSTWYAYLQDVRAAAIEREAVLAASVGMKTMILDDGWQKADSRTFYSACGDWMPVPSRFPDMRRHVDAVHGAGLKYMLWLAVPFMGDEAKNFARFKDKLLSCGSDGRGILDPRFPEVREYLITTYERVVRDWDFDGVKLDFIDSFVAPWDDPAAKDGYAGRDYRSVPEAVDRLMRDVRTRLAAIKPDVLIEFRQAYMGPAIRQYGNMIRAADCPGDACANRRRICDLRLTSGETAVHSDMLVWNRDETPEGAALPILSALFSTIQYSMILDTVRPEHRDVIRAWLAFSQAHRDTLLKGAFRPHHPENGYSWIEAESAGERIVAAYSADVCANCGAGDRPVYAINATGTDAMLLELPVSPKTIELFDVFGRPAGGATACAGIVRLRVPKSGYAKLTFARQCIAFLGGSITEMDGYRPRVMKALRERHPDVTFAEIAAGLSSTCSDTGAFRFSRDVLRQGVPDLLIVDAAVNDDQDGHFDRRKCVKGLEGSIRQALRANPRCRIVVAQMVNRGQYDLIGKGEKPIPYAAGEQVAARYGAAIADVGAALVASAKAGGMGWDVYRDCHPSPEGCDLGARVVLQAIEKVYDPHRRAEARTMPSPLDPFSYDSCCEIPLRSVACDGWRVTVPDWRTIPGSARGYYTRGEVLSCSQTNVTAEVAFTGTALAALITAGPDSGDLEVSVDGREFRHVRLRADYGKLHYPYTLMLADDLPEAAHAVRFRTVRALRKDSCGTTVRIHRLGVRGKEEGERRRDE